MLKVDDEVMDSAFCVGILAALVWGIGLSLYGLQEGSGQLSWLAWGVQLIGGILACLLVPPAFVLGRDWVLARLHPPVAPLQRRS